MKTSPVKADLYVYHTKLGFYVLNIYIQDKRINSFVISAKDYEAIKQFRKEENE